MKTDELIDQKEKELRALKEARNKEAIKEQQRSEIYQRIKSEVVNLESVLSSKLIIPCPFCGGNGSQSSEYDSDDNRPDGHQNFVSCDDCSAKGESFYCVSTREQNLSQEQFIVQEKHRLEAMINAIKAWNKRV